MLQAGTSLLGYKRILHLPETVIPESKVLPGV